MFKNLLKPILSVTLLNFINSILGGSIEIFEYYSS